MTTQSHHALLQTCMGNLPFLPLPCECTSTSPGPAGLRAEQPPVKLVYFGAPGRSRVSCSVWIPEPLQGWGVCILQTEKHIFHLFKNKNLPVNGHRASQRHSWSHRALPPYIHFYPFCTSAGGNQVPLLRTQINGTCCHTGSGRFLPFSPLLTPIHPLNSTWF